MQDGSSSNSEQQQAPSTPQNNQRRSYSYNSNSSNNSSNNFPLTPDSEHRRRKSASSLLIQKQRKTYHQQQQNGARSNSNSISSSMSGNRISPLELDRLILGSDDSIRSTGSSSSTATTRNNYYSSNNGRGCRGKQRPGSSPTRLKRFGNIMAMACAFCILVVLGEKHVEEENSMFQFGFSAEKKREPIKNEGSPMQSLVVAAGKTPTPTPTPTLQPQQTTDTNTVTPPSTHTNNNQQQSETDTTVTPKSNTGLSMANMGFGGGDNQGYDYNDDADNDDNEDEDDTIVKEPLVGDVQSGSNPNAHQLEWQTLEEQQQQQIVQEQQQQQQQQQSVQQQNAATKEHPNMPLRYPILPLDTSNNHSFVRRHCNLQGTDWFPYDKNATDNSNANEQQQQQQQQQRIPSWHQRAPFILLLGPPHGGSDVVYELLKTHPQVADAMESHFFTFNHKLFVRQVVGPNATTRIRTRAARDAYMARHVSTKRQLQKYPSEIVVDNVPETLLYSHRFAPFVLCVMPWVKLVITVSHPVRRLLKHYQQATSHGLKLTLEEWIARDLERMQDAGLLVKNTKNGTTQTYLVPGTNHDAWNKYQDLTPAAMDASAGQSLYEFMVHPWFSWMEQMGRNPQTEILLVQRELLVQHQHQHQHHGSMQKTNNPRDTLIQEYQRIVQRLGLAPHTPPKATVDNILALQEKHDWIEEIDEDLRKQLRRFFKPYNDRFDQFLQSYYHTDGGLTTTNSSLLHWNPALWQVKWTNNDKKAGSEKQQQKQKEQQPS